MSEEDFSSQSDDVFVAPPDDFDDDFGLDEPPKWPKVVGIISIVFGVLSFTCTGVGVGGQFLFKGAIQGAMSQMKGGAPPVLTNPNPMLYVAGAVGIVWALVLIVAGAVTIGRKPVGRIMHLIWCVGAIVLFVWGVSLQLQAQHDIAQWVSQHPSSDYAQMTQGKSSQIGLMLGIAFGAIFGLVWPIFCLIWFGFVKTKPDDLTGGIEAPAA